MTTKGNTGQSSDKLGFLKKSGDGGVTMEGGGGFRSVSNRGNMGHYDDNSVGLGKAKTPDTACPPRFSVRVPGFGKPQSPAKR